MVVQYTVGAFGCPYCFADPEMIKLYFELFGLDKTHILIRKTI